jgi:class 3 adenylate cyclase/tetratricopeptide (TPR) repeat protein
VSVRSPPVEGLVSYVPRVLLEREPARPGHWSVDGTLVFADISGFTRLTERLARQGKAGAEEVVTTLSRIFTALLEPGQGGDVLKFGGDALLLLYTGPDHTGRACAGARWMQRTLRGVGSVASSQGRVRLRMSVGVHTGSLAFFLVGEPDALELFVLGPDATRLVEVEGAAQAGEVLLSAEAAAAVDPGALGTSRDGVVPLRRTPTVPTTASCAPAPLPPDAAERAGRYVPRLLRDRLGRDLDQEHRRAATSFVHVGGVDALLRRAGPEEVHARIDAVTREVLHQCDELGILLVATDLAADGGKFMLTAGAPEAGEDDEGRLLRGVRRIVDTDVGLPIRAGVNHGHVFAGDVGAPWRRTYSTMGDVVNLAARLQSRALPGQVLASRTVVDRASGRFVTHAVPPFHVKGKSQPVDAVLVGPPQSEAAEDTGPASTPPDRDRPPMVGRDAELAQLEAMLADALAGRGRVVEVTGDLGTGKTRLVTELATRATTTAWVSLRGDPYATRTPYHLGRALLRRLLRIPASAEPLAAGDLLVERLRAAAPDLLPWAPLLAIPVGGEVASTPEVERVDERFRRARMHAVTGQLLAATIGPGVVTVDGAEHVDEASADLLGDVLRDVLPDRPWLVVLCRRTGTEDTGVVAPAAASTLHLGPLDPASETELLRHACTRSPVPDHATTAIRRRAAGNPLFLLELVRTASTAGSVDALPGSVESILASRLDALPATDRQALRELAVLGEEATHPEVDHVLADLHVRGTDRAFWDRLQEHVDQRPGGLRFRHTLVRQVAYEGLTYRRRRELHSRAADVLRATGDETTRWALSWHLLQAERWPEAWTAAVEAGDRALTAYAHAEAAASYRRALDAAQRVPDLAPDARARVAERWGDTSELAGLYPDAAAAFNRARRDAVDPSTVLRLLRKRGIVEERLGRYSEALRWYGRGLHAAQDVTDDRDLAVAVAQLEAAYAGVLFRQGRLRESVRRAERAAAAAERAEDLPTLAHACYLLDNALTDLGEDTAALRYRHRALPIFEELGDLLGQANVLNNLGIDAFFAGDHDAALALYRRSRAAREAAGDVVGTATADHNIAEVLLERDELDEAARLFAEALRIYRGARYALGVAYAEGNLATIAARRGDHVDAVASFRTALTGFEELGGGPIVAETGLGLARSLAELGRWVEVWEVTDRLADHGRSTVREAAARLRIRALEATGSTDRAAELASQLELT